MRWPSWRAWKCAPPTTASMAPDTSTRFRANVYGPGDHFELDRAHVIAALMRRFHDARKIRSRGDPLGTGRPGGSFLFVDDWLEACAFAAGKARGNHPAISDLNKFAQWRNWRTPWQPSWVSGKNCLGPSKPDGAKKKSRLSSDAQFRWHPCTDLKKFENKLPVL